MIVIQIAQLRVVLVMLKQLAAVTAHVTVQLTAHVIQKLHVIVIALVIAKELVLVIQKLLEDVIHIH